LHVRDGNKKPSQSLEDFKKSVAAIREAVKKAGLEQPIIQFSTGGAVGTPMDLRVEPLSLKPEMGSFNLGTMNFGSDIFVNTRPDMRDLAKAFSKYLVVPEFEIYDLGHIDELKALIREELIQPPYHVQFVLGVPGGALPFDPAKPDTKRLEFLISELPKPHTWGVAGIGRFERPFAELAIPLGGHVRVGLEDNIYLRKGVLAKSNAELVKDIAELAGTLGRKIATITEARKILGV
jgi:3-keto-5-aminohexanoate cleavage enzyme